MQVAVAVLYLHNVEECHGGEDLLCAHLAAQQGVGDEGGEGGDDRDGEEREAIPGDVTLLLGTHSNDVSCQDCSCALWESRVSVLVVVGHLGAELGQLLLAVLTDTILRQRDSRSAERVITESIHVEHFVEQQIGQAQTLQVMTAFVKLC